MADEEEADGGAGSSRRLRKAEPQGPTKEGSGQREAGARGHGAGAQCALTQDCSPHGARSGGTL
jgi:hypothetical protein